MIDSHLQSHLPEIKAKCLFHDVSKLYAFGSVVDGRFNYGTSDIDFLIEFENESFTKQEISRKILLLWIDFQEILNSKVDIILNKNIKGRYFKKYLELYKVLIFDKNEI